MEFRKNDLVTLEIEDCGIDGEGIGKAICYRYRRSCHYTVQRFLPCWKTASNQLSTGSLSN